MDTKWCAKFRTAKQCLVRSDREIQNAINLIFLFSQALARLALVMVWSDAQMWVSHDMAAAVCFHRCHLAQPTPNNRRACNTSNAHALFHVSPCYCFDRRRRNRIASLDKKMCQTKVSAADYLTWRTVCSTRKPNRCVASVSVIKVASNGSSRRFFVVLLGLQLKVIVCNVLINCFGRRWLLLHCWAFYVIRKENIRSNCRTQQTKKHKTNPLCQISEEYIVTESERNILWPESRRSEMLFQSEAIEFLKSV